MSLLKGVQVALFLSTTTFSLLSLPLIKFGDQSVEVNVDYQTQFVGSLRDISTPYLGGIALLSASLGTAALGVAGWRASHHQRKTLAQSLASLETQLAKKEAQIQSLKLSDRRLQSSDLDQFLLDAAPTQTAKVTSATVSSTPVTTIRTAAPQARESAPTIQVVPQAVASPSSSGQAPQVLQVVPRQVPQQPRRTAATHAFSVQAGYKSQPTRYGGETVRNTTRQLTTRQH